jgi:hypothetical protein
MKRLLITAPLDVIMRKLFSVILTTEVQFWVDHTGPLQRRITLVSLQNYGNALQVNSKLLRIIVLSGLGIMSNFIHTRHYLKVIQTTLLILRAKPLINETTAHISTLRCSFVVTTHLPTPSTMDRDSNMLPSTASVEEHQNERQSSTNGTRQRQPIPWRNFGLCTLYAPYKATQHTLSQHNDKTKLSPYQASPTRKMDEAQHIPTSAHHGTEPTMQNTAATQQVSVLDNIMVAGKLRAFYRAIVWSKPPPPTDSTSTTHSPNSNPCRAADGYQSKACQPHSKVAKWTITRKIPPSPHRESWGRNRLAAPAYDTTKPQWEVTYLGWDNF